MTMNNVVKIEFQKDPSKIGQVVPKKDYGGSGGGGGDMTEYVTREEFNSSIKDLGHKIDLNYTQVELRLTMIEQKLENNQTLTNQKIDSLKESNKQTDKKVNWMISLIVISILVPILLPILSQYFTK